MMRRQTIVLWGLALMFGAAAFTNAQISGGSAYLIIEDEDTPLTRRTRLNFTGSGVTCADDTNQTECTISGGAGSPGGSSGDLQINDGAGGFDPYAGDGCSPGVFVTDIAADGAVTCDTPSGSGGGEWSLRFTALANLPPASNPATFNTRNATPVLEFDTTTQEIAIFLSVLPNDYAAGGLTVCAHWATASATTGTGGWDVAIERIGDSQQDIDSDAFATAQTITAVTVPASTGLVDITCVNIANGADMDSLVGGESFRLRVRRDVANDTAAGDAQLLAISLVEQ